MPGAQVRTDLAEGTVSFRSTVARTYSLPYQAAYGNAPLARGRIRVDVRPRGPARPGGDARHDDAVRSRRPPWSTSSPTTSTRPAGCWSIQGARALQRDQVDVAVVDGRWVRVSPREGQLPAPQVVRYTISNGSRSAVGEITVSQRPVPPDNAPVTEVDRVTVRAGAGAAIPVLDNDFSPSGDALDAGRRRRRAKRRAADRARPRGRDRRAR